MIRRPAALLLALCLAGLAGPRLVLAASPTKQPAVMPAAPSPPAARSPAPVPAPAATTADSAPVLDRGTATPAAKPVPAKPASHAPVVSAAAAPASPTSPASEGPGEAWEVPVGADLGPEGRGHGPSSATPIGGPVGLPETTTLVLVALGMLAVGCATGLAVLGKRATVPAPDAAATLAAATRRRIQEAPMLPWEDPVLTRMHLDRPGTGGSAQDASGRGKPTRPSDDSRSTGGPPTRRP